MLERDKKYTHTSSRSGGRRLNNGRPSKNPSVMRRADLLVDHKVTTEEYRRDSILIG